MTTTYNNQKINGINFEFEVYSEKAYQSDYNFEPSEPGFIEITGIKLFNGLDVPDRVYTDLMSIEDEIIEMIIELEELI